MADERSTGVSANTTPRTTRTTKPKAPAIPALLPGHAFRSPLYWAVEAINADAEAQAIESLLAANAKKRPTSAQHTTDHALACALNECFCYVDLAFKNSKQSGVLLYAWRGSKALVQGFPASLKGRAA